MELQVNCPNCKQNILVSDYFCPNCGKKIKDKPLPVTVIRQIFIYLLSFFLPPLGLWPAIKYLKQKDEKSRMIGFITIALTVISIAITVWMTFGFMNVFNQQLNSNLNLYR
jgi:DNA-directed RNA polymerase subunit RPC12/RpoP